MSGSVIPRLIKKEITIVPIKIEKNISNGRMPYYLLRRIKKVLVIVNKTPIQSLNLKRIFKAIAVPSTS